MRHGYGAAYGTLRYGCKVNISTVTVNLLGLRKTNTCLPGYGSGKYGRIEKQNAAIVTVVLKHVNVFGKKAFQAIVRSEFDKG